MVQYAGFDPDGYCVGQTAASKTSMHGATPVAQRSGSAQAAVSATASTTTSPAGYTTTTQANAIVTLVNEIRAALVEKGVITGA